MKPANTLTVFAAVLLCGLVAGRAPLYAQPRGATIAVDGDDKPWSRGVPLETRQAARELFLEGNRLFYIPLYTRAAEKYAAALGKWKHPAFYFNLALTQINLGQEVEAHENLQHALQQGEEPLGALQFHEAQKQLQELEHSLGRIRITCGTPGARVTLDGGAVLTGPGSYQGWVKAKPHEITAKRQGYLSEARQISVAPNSLQNIDLNLVTLTEAEDTSRSWSPWKPWAVVATGGAVAVASAGIHLLSSRNFNAYDDRFLQLPCAQATGCREDQIPTSLARQLDRARLEQKIAIGGYIAGGAIIATGITLLYLNRPHIAEQESGSTPAPGVAVVPTASPNSFGFMVTVSH